MSGETRLFKYVISARYSILAQQSCTWAVLDALTCTLSSTLRGTRVLYIVDNFLLSSWHFFVCVAFAQIGFFSQFDRFPMNRLQVTIHSLIRILHESMLLQ